MYTKPGFLVEGRPPDEPTIEPGPTTEPQVREFICEGGVWNEAWIRELVDPTDVGFILAMPLPCTGGEDEHIWPNDKRVSHELDPYTIS